MRRYSVLGTRPAKDFRDSDESRLLETPRVNAEVAVRRAELVPKLAERPGPADRERARDREAEPLVEDEIEIRTGFQGDVLRM